MQEKQRVMAQLFNLNATHNPHRWYLPVIDEFCVGRPDRRFLFGGVALAAAISALEQTCERPVIWATAQYMSFARPGSIVDLDVWVPVKGNQTSQAYVIEHIDDRKIITVNAALGSRQSDICDQWLPIPEVPRPEECPEVHGWRRPVEGILGRFETRLAQGRFATGEPIKGRGEDGRVRFWIRSREGLPTDRKLLACRSRSPTPSAGWRVATAWTTPSAMVGSRSASGSFATCRSRRFATG
jgi:acyl-CoA thioesterase-2